MMVNPDGTRREIGPDDRHTINPYTLGQLDAQRQVPRPPLYDSPADAQRYAAGWLEHDLHRPAPNVLHPRWRWLPVIRVWRQLRRRRQGTEEPRIFRHDTSGNEVVDDVGSTNIVWGSSVSQLNSRLKIRQRRMR